MSLSNSREFELLDVIC